MITDNPSKQEQRAMLLVRSILREKESGRNVIKELISEYGISKALLVVWHIYLKNKENNAIKSLFLRELADLDDENINRFAMALVSEQLRSGDVEMVQRALDYIEKKPTYEAELLLRITDVPDCRTEQRIEEVLGKLKRLYQVTAD